MIPPNERAPTGERLIEGWERRDMVMFGKYWSPQYWFSWTIQAELYRAQLDRKNFKAGINM